MDSDWAAEAQKAAEEHLAACYEAMWDEHDEGLDSPAIAPFCGCDTCVVREVLWAAWSHLQRGVTSGGPTTMDGAAGAPSPACEAG